MNLKRFFRIRHFLKAIKYWISDGLSIQKIDSKKDKTLLIVRVEAIGDYFHFRNFLRFIKESEKYKDYKITLCGNIMYKDIAEEFDTNEIDSFIWVNRKQFIHDNVYRKKLIIEINSKKFSVAIQPNFSREFLIGDSIIRASNAAERIGAIGDTTNDIFIFKFISDLWYTKRIQINEEIIWEFDRNKDFIEKLLNQKIDLKAPNLNYKKEIKENYIVLFPGAGEKIKQWPQHKFAELTKYIYQKYNTKIVICGSTQDIQIGNEIMNGSVGVEIENLCGKTSLIELIDIINKSQVLITNDSSAFHIGACTNTETIGLFMGRHYGRFAPYPKGTDAHIHYIYPDSIKKLLSNEKEAIKKTKHAQPALMEEITVKQVTTELDKIFQYKK